MLDFNMPNRKWELVLKEAAYDAIFERVQSKLSLIKSSIIVEVRRAINASPVITSMLGGKLQAEFGFIEPQSVVNRLLDAIEKAIEVNIAGKDPLLLEIILDKDILMQSDIVEFSTKNGDVPWLEWLLSSGGKVVIYDYHIEYGIFPRKSKFAGSRSGQARMVPGGTYAVGKFAGTKEKNFITDSFDEKTVKLIGAAIEGAIR